MPTYQLFDGKETYHVNSKGLIGRSPEKIGGKHDDPIQYSGDWEAVALIQRGAFGRIIRYIPFKDWETFFPVDRKDIIYQNGKPRLFLIDNDHGTRRQWGRGFTWVCKLEDSNAQNE